MTVPSTSLPKDFHWIQIADIQKETANSVSVTLNIPKELQSAFAYEAGQYVTVLHEVEGRVHRRPYSLCHAPDKSIWQFCSRAMPHGLVSGYINRDLKAGDWLPVRLPQGRFVYKADATAKRTIVGFCADAGITPMIAIIEDILNAEPQSHFHLFFANSEANDITFLHRLASLKDTHMQRFAVHHLIGRDDPAKSLDAQDNLLEGSLTTPRVQAICETLFDVPAIDQFLVCGPGEMVMPTVKTLRKLGVARERLLMESFGTADLPDNDPSDHPTSDHIPFSAKATLIIGGETRQVSVAPGQSVLDAALDAQMDMPFACKGGVCCTCKAKLLDGKVSMAVNYGLEPEEVAAGYVLTCQARPETDSVTLEY